MVKHLTLLRVGLMIADLALSGYNPLHADQLLYIIGMKTFSVSGVNDLAANAVSCFTFDSLGNRLFLCTTRNSRLRVATPSSRTLLHEIKLPIEADHLACSLDGRMLVITGRNSTCILDTSSLKLLRKIDVKNSIPIFGRLEKLWLVSADRVLAIEHDGTGEIHERRINIGAVSSYTRSPDGRYAALGGLNVVRIWAVEHWHLIRTLKCRVIHTNVHDAATNWVNSIAYSPDSRWLAAADGLLHVWNIRSWSDVKMRPSIKLTSTVEGVNFSSNSHILATAGQGIALWSMPTRDFSKCLSKNEYASVDFWPRQNLLIAIDEATLPEIWFISKTTE